MALETRNSRAYVVVLSTGSGKNRNRIRITLGPKTKWDRVTANTYDKMITGLYTTVQTRQTFDRQQQLWLSEIPDSIHRRLERFGLVRDRVARRTHDSFKLGNIRIEYQSSGEFKKSTEANQNRAFDLLIKKFGEDRDVRDINQAEAEQFAKWLPKQRKQGSGDLLATTVSGHLKKIDAMFNHLIKSKLLDNNPFRHIKKPMKRDSDKDCEVSTEEAREIVESQNDPQLAAFVQIGRFCGIRGPSDVLYLQNKHVDFETMFVTFPSTKNGTRKCPIFQEVIDVFKWLTGRESDPEGYLFKDNPKKGRRKMGAWEKGRSTGLTKNISPLSLIKKRYSKVTGKTVCDRLFKNMRATRSKELTLVPGITHQTVCKWIGNTIAVSNEHYLTPSQSEHARAVALVTEKKPTSKKETNMWANLWAILPSPSLSTQLSDAPQDRLMKGRAQHQPVQGTLLLQELTTLLHSNPVATDLLLSSISKTTKNLKSSSNRGRTCTPEGTGS